MAALEQRISAVEMITQNLPGKSSVETLNGQVAQLQKEVGALATRGDLTALEDKLAALTKTVDALPPGATHDELAALAERVATLEAGGTAPAAAAAARVGSRGGALPPYRYRADRPQCAWRPAGGAGKEACRPGPATARPRPAPSPSLR